MTVDSKSPAKAETVARVHFVLACRRFVRVKVNTGVTEQTDQQLPVSLKLFHKELEKFPPKLDQRPLTATCVCEYEYLIMRTV